jgi:hypothetical protein
VETAQARAQASFKARRFPATSVCSAGLATADLSMVALSMAALSMVVLVLGACGSPETPTTAAWCAADSGVAVAFTGADDPGAWAREGRGAPRFVELWRAGGLNEGEELAFPLSAAVSRSGRLAIADFLLSEVAVVDADGAWHGRWAQPGKGPGELSKPVAAGWDGNGSVVILDIEGPKMLFVGEEGPTRPDIRLPVEMVTPILVEGSLDWAGAAPDGTALLQPSPHLDSAAAAATTTTPARSAVLVAPPDEEGFDTLASATTPTVGGPPPYGATRAPAWPALMAAVGPAGRFAVGGETTRYRVRFVDDDGAKTRVLCRDTPPVPFASRETRRPEGSDPAPELEAAVAAAPRPDVPAPYGRIFFAADGRFWVQRDRPSPLGFLEGYLGVPGALYDVFDAAGAYLGEVRAPPDARFQAALGDTVWAYEIGDLDETWVVAYEMRWD